MMSVHDNLLTGYSVDGVARAIVLHTESRDGGGSARVDVTFSGVVAYHFEADCLQNIVSEVVEVSAESVIGDGTAFLDRHQRAGWPTDWDPTRETAEQFLKRQGCRCFELICSYGMRGWVAAQRMDLQLPGHDAQPRPSTAA